jgi:hypothetical protein
MLNFLKNNKPWMAASLLAATSVFGQQSCKPTCEPCCVPHQLLQCPTVAAYNAPARIDIQCGWDVWVDASFIYWQANQENMEPAEFVTSPTTTLGTEFQTFPILDFKYKPGFKVGLGMSFDYDNWDAGLEYTRLHGTHKRSGELSNNAALAGDVWTPTWPNQINIPIGSGNKGFTAYDASWRVNLDFLDMDLGRWFYVGTQLTFHPSIGARVAWINQHRSANYFKSVLVNPALTVTDTEKTDSWGIGPRLCLDMNWMIGAGFRFFGTSEIDILFSRYNWTGQSDNLLSGSAILVDNSKQNDINVLRPHVDLELGFAWGTYLDCHKWHVDFSASYGYQLFWNQNMFHFPYSGGTNVRYVMANGDLMVHGLTVTAKLDF